MNSVMIVVKNELIAEPGIEYTFWSKVCDFSISSINGYQSPNQPIKNDCQLWVMICLRMLTTSKEEEAFLVQFSDHFPLILPTLTLSRIPSFYCDKIIPNVSAAPMAQRLSHVMRPSKYEVWKFKVSKIQLYQSSVLPTVSCLNSHILPNLMEFNMTVIKRYIRSNWHMKNFM